MQKKILVLFSGGLDSTTCLAIAKSQGFACYALTIHYGQKHHIEVEQAKQIAKKFGVIEHKIIKLPLFEFGGSSLTDPKIPVPDYQESMEIPNTYVPARNTVMLSLALSYSEVHGIFDIYFGANIIDYSQYPDCRPEYIAAFENVAKLATKLGVESPTQSFKIHTPLLFMTKAQVIEIGLKLGVDYGKTISCYRANHFGFACGTCDSCTYRKKGFADANVPDPTPYYETV